ncbi:MAG: hypothetical protein ACRDHN_19640, partial [Thermomicrobiales bacterium]
SDRGDGADQCGALPGALLLVVLLTLLLEILWIIRAIGQRPKQSVKGPFDCPNQRPVRSGGFVLCFSLRIQLFRGVVIIVPHGRYLFSQSG